MGGTGAQLMPGACEHRSELATCSQRGQGTRLAPSPSGFAHRLLPWREDTLLTMPPPGSASSGWGTATGTRVEAGRTRRGVGDGGTGTGVGDGRGGRGQAPRRRLPVLLCRGCRTLRLAPQVLSPPGDSGLALLGTSWMAQACACVHVCGACAAHSCRACQGVPPAYTDADGVHRRQEEAAGNLGKGAVSGGRLCSAVAPACAPVS